MAVPGDVNYLQVGYTINIPDVSLVLQYQAQYPNGYPFCPATAAGAYAAPLISSYGNNGPPPGLPYTNARPVNPTDFLSSGVDSVNYPALTTPYNDAISLSHYPPGGPYASSFAGGTVAWIGTFLAIPAAPTATYGPLETVYSMEGFESTPQGASHANVQLVGLPAYSRVFGDLGTTWRDRTANFSTSWTPSTTIKTVWSQIYFRVAHVPTSNEYFMRWRDGGVGSTLYLDVGISSIGNLYTLSETHASMVNHFTPAKNVWYRLDIFSSTGSNDPLHPVSNHAVYVNKAYVGSNSETCGAASNVASVEINRTSDTAIGNYIDLDDWTERSWTIAGPNAFQFNSLDWLTGTHIIKFVPTAFSADSSPNWVGDPLWMAAAYSNIQANGVVNATASSRLATTMNLIAANNSVLKNKGIGCSALQLSVIPKNLRTSTGASFGVRYSTIADPTTILTASIPNELGVSGIAGTYAIPLNLGGTVMPVALASLDGIFDCGTLSASTEIIGFNVSGTFLGNYGPEDDPALAVLPQVNVHQYPYFNSQYVTMAPGQAPASPVAIMSGTYVGNGTHQTITMSAPPYWVYIRDLTADAGGTWSSCMVAGTKYKNAGYLADMFGPPVINNDGTCSILIEGGPQSAGNISGRTYQWVALSDPGMRFHINGSVAGEASFNSFQSFNLIDPQFTPDAAFCMIGSSGTGAATKTWYKGPGHATNAASQIDSADTAAALALSRGAISPQTPLIQVSPDVSYTVWRKTDDRGFKGVCEIMTYTGNGTSPRNITLDLNGGSPLWCFVMPHTGSSPAGAVFRDPSHTGSNSTWNNGGVVSIGITAGDVNQITVGSQLNQNAIVYDVFCIAGPANPGGWAGQTPLSIPVPSTTPLSNGPYLPSDPNGWWLSSNGFTGGADIVTSTQRPYAPRDWTKLSPYDAAGTGPSYLGGFPGASASYNNHIIYPGNNYSVGTDQPPLRIFDGISDRELTRIPNTATGGIAFAILSVMRQGDAIYLTTLDSGTTSSNYAGRVFTYDPLANTLAVLGSFSGGEVPYALCWHMGRLFVGTNKGSGAGGKIYYIRPGIDTTFTTDYTLATSSAGGCVSLCSAFGYLFVGTDNSAASFALVLKRDATGVYTTALTATGGTARVNNAFTYLAQFGTSLVAAYWNPDTTAVTKIYTTLDGTTWATSYTGATTALRPYILMFQALNYLYICGGARDRSAFIMRTNDLVTFTDLTAFLSGPTTETIIPTVGLM